MKSTVKKVVFVTIGVMLTLPIYVLLMLGTLGVHVSHDQVGAAVLLSMFAVIYWFAIGALLGVFDD